MRQARASRGRYVGIGPSLERPRNIAVLQYRTFDVNDSGEITYRALRLRWRDDQRVLAEVRIMGRANCRITQILFP